jgi:site-specific DNA-methyltransferase (adenine-specific)
MRKKDICVDFDGTCVVMRLEKNKVHNMDWVEGAYLLPAKSVNLIIADPPYFEVKGAFDFIWDSFEDYLKDVEKWAKACKHLLSDNGTLFVYGHAKKIAYVQVIFDRLFNLENSLVWEKVECQTKRQDFDKARSFAPITERILLYSNEVIRTGLEEIQNNQSLYRPIRDYFLEQKMNSKLTFKQINEQCFSSASNGGGMASNILTSYKDGWSFPTKEKYEALQAIGLCPKPYDELRQSYDELRQSYEELRRPFDNSNRLTDVMKFSQEGHKTGQYDHDTVKPEMLSRALILTCSKKGDLVFVPFAGSGTECAMSAKEGRDFIGFDVVAKYCKMSNDRASAFLNNSQLPILDAA